MQTVLVTGGAGFIGSALIRHLIRHTRYTVINVDKLTYAGSRAALETVSDNPRYVFEQADICDRVAMDRIFKQYSPDCVIHLAAESHVDRSIGSAEAFVQTNLVGTFILLEATRTYWQQMSSEKQEAFRFLHVSTDEVYGDLGGTEEVSDENSLYAPSSPYAATKAGSDHLVRAWMRTYGIPILISHCSNNYGCYQFPEKLIPLMIANALKGQQLPIYGSGENIRDWLYVDDHVRALCQIIESGRVGETYNIGSGCGKSNLEVVHAVCTLLEEICPNKPEGVARYADLIVHIADRAGHDERYALNDSKLRHELGWQPQETFESGLRKTVAWYVANKNWWQDILNGK